MSGRSLLVDEKADGIHPYARCLMALHISKSVNCKLILRPVARSSCLPAFLPPPNRRKASVFAVQGTLCASKPFPRRSVLAKPMPRKSATSNRLPRIVIVGGGFGGLAAAKPLLREAADLTVIDRRNHHLFQPLLYQVATAALSPADIAAPIRALLHARRDRPLRVLLDEVTGIDTARKCVLTEDGGRIFYDMLVVATGSQYSYFGHGDWARTAPGLKSLEDATDIRRRILLAFEKAETCGSRLEEEQRKKLLTFVIIGGGPTGVEMAGALAELARATLARDFREIDPGSARVVLVEAESRLLAAFPESLGAYARRALEKKGVEVMLGKPVEHIGYESVRVGDVTIGAATTIWCAGVTATPVARWLGVEPARGGRVAVETDLSVPGLSEVFVIGDAALAQKEDGSPLPGLAPVAKQEGRYVAEVIARRLTGKPAPGPFRYRDRGSMATIGRSSAVGLFGRAKVTGALAWILWGAVHITYLIGFRNRVAVALNWVWAWATYAKGARLITGPPPAAGSGRMCQPQEAKERPMPISGIRRSTVLGAALVGIAALSAFVVARKQRRTRLRRAAPAFADAVGAADGGRGGYGESRPAGPSSMRDPDQDWDLVDEASDESFPASDPPSFAAPPRGRP